MPIGGTAVWWVIESIILFIIILSRATYFDFRDKKNFLMVTFYLLWITICLVRGFFVAETYWDYKSLITNIFVLLIPFIAYVSTNLLILQSILAYYVRYALPLSLLILPFTGSGAWGWYFFPISFLMLFFPAIKIQWKILLLFISFTVVLADISARSFIIKYGLPIVILSFYYLRHTLPTIKIMSLLHKVFMIAPWILFILAVSGVFNVLNMKDYIKKENNQYGQETEAISELIHDSRTFIYKEVLTSAVLHNYIAFGRTPARGNETIVFKKNEEITGRSERIRNEVNIPNVLTWLGVVGVILYFSVYCYSSYLAINKSNNIFSKLIGLFVAIRWMYAWVEDYFYFDINNFVIWIMIGVSLSTAFRQMNDIEVKLWIQGVFSKKYSVSNIRLINAHISKINFAGK